METSFFPPEAIAILESRRLPSGINPISRDALSLVGNMDSGLSFGPDPREWGPSDYVAAVCPSLSLLTQGQNHASLLWSLVFSGVKSGLESFPETSAEYLLADSAGKVIQHHLSTKRSV